MLDSNAIKAAVLAKLPGTDKKLSVQAKAVIECLCDAINKAKPNGSGATGLTENKGLLPGAGQGKDKCQPNI